MNGLTHQDLVTHKCNVSLRKAHLKMSAKWRPLCFSLNVLEVDGEIAIDFVMISMWCSRTFGTLCYCH